MPRRTIAQLEAAKQKEWLAAWAKRASQRDSAYAEACAAVRSALGTKVTKEVVETQFDIHTEFWYKAENGNFVVIRVDR